MSTMLRVSSTTHRRQKVGGSRAFRQASRDTPQRQLELYGNLAAAYPDDQRAHNLVDIHHFGQQDWTLAIAPFERATGLDPAFSAPYNMLGYARRFAGDMEGAENRLRDLHRTDP
ncbi:MAG TPA: hypothetical protein QF604_16635 [Candidatus Latescibacteria bacterium]|nr:hypothetical protein [Gemmatimonadota bacterium]MDP7362873.1 hypothetical protein [Candidatus Latescibacterota bacterium]HCV22197.1 hypothetical protein [Candidatus Latescibacterota bacterium]HJN29530.1 hypothetical protein [Candidatus Latescibacterota bacterium]